MEKPKANPHGRAEANKMIAAVFTGVKKLPKADTNIPENAQENIAQRDEAIKQLNTALPQLQQLIKSVPDNGAWHLAEFARDSSKLVGWADH